MSCASTSEKESKIVSVLHGYSVLGKIGSGTFTDVYSIMYKGTRRALRVPKKKYLVGGVDSCLELDILTRLRHPHLMWAEEVVFDRRTKVVSTILPHAETSILEVCRRHKWNFSQRLGLAFAITEAVAYLLKVGILHLDLKPDNILLYRNSDGEEVPLVTDFGTAVKLDDPKLPVEVVYATMTTEFKPYELLQGKSRYVGEHTLVWQLGILFLFIFSGCFLDVANEAEAELYLETYFNKERLTGSISSFLKEEELDATAKESLLALIGPMLELEVEARASLEQVLAQPIWRQLSRSKGGSPVKEAKEVKLSLEREVASTTFVHTEPLVRKARTRPTIREEGKTAFSVPPVGVTYLVEQLELLHLAGKTSGNPGPILELGIGLLIASQALLTDIQPKFLLTHSIACNLLAWKYYSYRIRNKVLGSDGRYVAANFLQNYPRAREYELTLSDLRKMEGRILLFIGGKVYQPWLRRGTGSWRTELGLPLPPKQVVSSSPDGKKQCFSKRSTIELTKMRKETEFGSWGLDELLR